MDKSIYVLLAPGCDRNEVMGVSTDVDKLRQVANDDCLSPVEWEESGDEHHGISDGGTEYTIVLSQLV